MAGITVTLESDLAALGREFRREMADGLRFAVKKAAEEGAEYAQRNHTYTDRTYDLTRGTTGRLLTFDRDSATAVLEWDEDYASYVDQGTRRSRAFPFSQEATLVAESELNHELHALAERVATKLSR